MKALYIHSLICKQRVHFSPQVLSDKGVPSISYIFFLKPYVLYKQLGFVADAKSFHSLSLLVWYGWDFCLVITVVLSLSLYIQMQKGAQKRVTKHALSWGLVLTLGTIIAFVTLQCSDQEKMLLSKCFISLLSLKLVNCRSL